MTAALPTYHHSLSRKSFMQRNCSEAAMLAAGSIWKKQKKEIARKKQLYSKTEKNIVAEKQKRRKEGKKGRGEAY